MGWVCWGFGTEPIVSCRWEVFFLVYELCGVGWNERQLMKRFSAFWERAERRIVGQEQGLCNGQDRSISLSLQERVSR